MFYANDVNTKNSTIKIGIDKWYVKYLSNYDNYLEDKNFCNNRTIKSLGAFNPNGGGLIEMSRILQFKESDTTDIDLSCTNETDQFSTLNPKAQLTYKVGLMSGSEVYLLNNGKTISTGSSYWLSSPHSFYGNTSYANTVYSSGAVYNSNVYGSDGVRPTISLKPGTTYLSGNGSMTSPYKVN